MPRTGQRTANPLTHPCAVDALAAGLARLMAASPGRGQGLDLGADGSDPAAACLDPGEPAGLSVPAGAEPESVKGCRP
jgi:hypothetical protein